MQFHESMMLLDLYRSWIMSADAIHFSVMSRKFPRKIESVNLLKCIFSAYIYCIKQIVPFSRWNCLFSYRCTEDVTTCMLRASTRLRLVGHTFVLTTLWRHLCIYNWTDNGKMNLFVNHKTILMQRTLLIYIKFGAWEERRLKRV